MSLTGLVFLLAYVSGLTLALFRHPRFGLYTYLAVFYLDPPSRWWGAFLPDLRWSLVAAVVTLVATLRLPPPKQGQTWGSTTVARLLIVFAVWMWIQNAWALAPPEHLEASVLFTKYVVLYYLIYRLLDSSEDVGNLLLVHVAGCGYLGVLAYLAPASGRLEGVGGPGIDDANALGMFVGTGVLCGAVLMLAERGWRRWVCILAMPFMLNALVQSASRGAMLGVVASGLILFYLRPRRYRWQFYAFATLGAVVFGYLAQDVFWERMNTLRATVDDTAELDGSAESRIVLAKAQLQMAMRYPLGAGHRGTAELSPSYLAEKWLTSVNGGPAARSSHSTLLSALVEQGIPGAIVFAGLLIWLARMIMALRRKAVLDPENAGKELLYGAAAAGSLAVVFVAGCFTDYIKTEVQVWMYAVLAVVVNRYVQPERVVDTEGRPAAIEAVPAATSPQARSRLG